MVRNGWGITNYGTVVRNLSQSCLCHFPATQYVSSLLWASASPSAKWKEWKETANEYTCCMWLTLLRHTHRMAEWLSLTCECPVGQAGWGPIPAHFSPQHTRDTVPPGAPAQHGPEDRAGSPSPAVAEEGWGGNFHSVGEVVALLPGGRLDPGLPFLAS